MSPSLRTGYFFAAATVFIWAGFVLFSRMAGSSALNGNDVTALRFATAAVFLFPVWWHKRLSLFDRRLFLLAITGGMGYAIAVYWSFHFSPAAHGAVLLSGVLPFFVAAVVWVVIGERPKPQIWKALLCIAAGVVCLGFHSLNGLSESWPGDLLLLLGCLLWAVYTVLVRKWGFTPIETTIGVTLISALCYLPVYVFLLPKGITETPWSSIITQAVYQGVIVAIVAMLLYMQALKRLGALRVGTAMATVPAIAGTGATLILGEPFSVWLLLGLVLTSLGAWLGTR